MNDSPTPIVTPIAALLTSRKFLVALITGIVNVLVIAVPSLEPVQNELITAFTALAVAIILGISHEDASEKGAPTTVNTGAGDVTVTPAAPPDVDDEAFHEGDTQPYVPPYKGNLPH